MLTRGQIVLAWTPAVLYMGVIWLLSSLDLASLQVSRFPFGDKGVHFVEYSLLGLLLAHAALRTWPRHHPLRPSALAVLIAVLFGLLDEIHQAMVPGRSSDAFDVLADGIGSFAGASLRFAISIVVPNKLQPNEQR